MKLNIRSGAWYGDNENNIKLPHFTNLQYFLPNDSNALSEEDIDNNIKEQLISQNLKNKLRNKKKLCIIIDDITRPTPVQKIIEILIDELIEIIPKENINILIGTGAHKPMTEEEITKKLGNKIPKEYKVINHDFMGNDLIYWGEFLNGPVTLNKYLLEADARITIGGILPHNETGFGGGSKLIIPGVAGSETISFFHGALPARKIGNINGENLDRREWSEKVCTELGIDLSIFILINSHRQIVDIVCGDTVSAHRIAAKRSKNNAKTVVPLKEINEADLCIINCYPLDSDPIQMGKAILSIKKYFSKKILVINTASDGVFYHGMGMGSGIDINRLKGNVRKFYKLSEIKRYLKTIRKVIFKPVLFLRYTYFFLNPLPYSQFRKEQKEVKNELTPNKDDDFIIFSENFPASGLIKKYPKAKLLKSYSEMEQYFEKIAPRKVIVFPCAPIQLIEIEKHE